MNPPSTFSDKPPKPIPSPIGEDSPIESEILHYLIKNTLNESAIVVDSMHSCIGDLKDQLKAPFFGADSPLSDLLGADLPLSESLGAYLPLSESMGADLPLSDSMGADLPVSNSFVPETEMEPSHWRDVVPDSEFDSEMVGETELHRGPKASGGISKGEMAALTAVEMEKESKVFHKEYLKDLRRKRPRLDHSGDEMLRILLPAYFNLVRSFLSLCVPNLQ